MEIFSIFLSLYTDRLPSSISTPILLSLICTDRLPSSTGFDSLLAALASNADLKIFIICFRCQIAQISAYDETTVVCTHLATIRTHLDEITAVRSVHPDVAANRALDMDEDDEVTSNDVFLHVHMKDHDGVTFIDNRSSQFHLVRRREEHTQATPDQPIDEKQLYYDATRECSKGRVYGLGSLAKRKRRYEDPGAIRGIRVEPVENADGLRSKHLSGTTTATTAATNSGASSAGWDGSDSLTIAAT
ncbi:hypothetical protein Scep_009719 [Stephania cephalantha]|uniref:Uncharacterized protein n=1 Tax=Stephania cephalantha TaxID=152367 RepID=A0AAP0JTP2_9MAGN